MERWTLREFEAAARERLDPAHYDYFAGGAGDEITVRANEAAFARLGLLPRVLRGAAKLQTGVTLLGSRAAMPVLVAPTAFHRLADPEGERATARAAAAAETIMIVSMASTVAVGDVAAAAPGAELWFQLYLQPDESFTETVVRRAEAAGCRALVVTADSPVHGRRERDLRNGFLDLPEHLCCENMRDGDRVRPIVMSPELSWRHLDRLREMTSLPIVVKGVAHPEDARIALDHGISAIMVSNHGGRQLDTVPAAVDLLPDIVAAVGGAVPVLLDGGVRRGTDVLKALALGAAAVAVGRPVIWGLAAGGERGVASVLALLRAEVEQALTLCGCACLADLDAGMVRRPC
ncbi:alpha-hydroxy-acid oxidizing protein [Nonomuraea phyllanthi]|uniref:Alpha-hydroxy-acid oxidizing protein n=1 Tax=Nonomuraea phyllanthi TaxID=2219224 RepID=A0A5C4WCC8_9ACTN|nr:alpha-hydroxy acid oxidase [Nonomuraea phyllanthi]KAB8193200.1 alpha-hydroxy-acid oxidizing protein [Nonomuraea phyllanthi]QFY10939.1 alpha-hydroxy-acid oxidizing protein [Nonomuraea phyllanthi]